MQAPTVREGDEERTTMSDSEARNFTYLAYGLIACWVILVAYVLTLTARGRRLTRQLENVKRMMEDREVK